jgi:hypothetical protein
MLRVIVTGAGEPAGPILTPTSPPKHFLLP